MNKTYEIEVKEDDKVTNPRQTRHMDEISKGTNTIESVTTFE